MLNCDLFRRVIRLVFVICLLALPTLPAKAQDKPYFVTYSDDMEDPGEVEIETKTALATPGGGNPFGAMAAEFGYGIRAWWTAEVYLDGQATDEDSALLTGFRWESRLRPLSGEHVINPVLYLEFEDISGADKTLLEVVGHDAQADLKSPNSSARRAHLHEGELKLIFSSDVRHWNISENFISEKNLGHAPWEFGYSVGATRPLRSSSSGNSCTLCLEKLIAGVEVYGGLGDTAALTLRQTSHYLSPLIGWQLPKSVRLSFSPGFGLTESSLKRVYRIGFAYEFGGMGASFRGAEHD